MEGEGGGRHSRGDESDLREPYYRAVSGSVEPPATHFTTNRERHSGCKVTGHKILLIITRQGLGPGPEPGPGLRLGPMPSPRQGPGPGPGPEPGQGPGTGPGPKTRPGIGLRLGPEPSPRHGPGLGPEPRLGRGPETRPSLGQGPGPGQPVLCLVHLCGSQLENRRLCRATRPPEVPKFRQPGPGERRETQLKQKRLQGERWGEEERGSLQNDKLPRRLSGKLRGDDAESRGNLQSALLHATF